MASTASVATQPNLGLRQNRAGSGSPPSGGSADGCSSTEQAERLVHRRQPGRLRGQGDLHRGQLAAQTAAPQTATPAPRAGSQATDRVG